MPLAIIPVLKQLIDVFDAVLVFFHDNIGLSWGMAIVALTIAVRTLLLPLTLKQAKSMQRLAQLSPEIKALQARYKDDKQRMNEEMMKFYRENKVNPLSSCLPLVAQFPVFISLYYMLRTDLKHDICPGVGAYAASLHKSLSNVSCSQFYDAHPKLPNAGSESFLFIPDLTAAATGGVLVALIVLYVGSQLAATLLTPAAVDRTQRSIMLALPFIFVIFIIQFPAGLIVYWITTNLWTIGQQYFVRRTVGPITPAAAGAGGAEGPKDWKERVFGRAPEPGSGGLAERLGLAPAGGGDRGGAAKGSAAKGDGGKSGGRGASREKAKAGAGAKESGSTRASGPPPRPPRKKKKRSGRRR